MIQLIMTIKIVVKIMVWKMVIVHDDHGQGNCNDNSNSNSYGNSKW